MATIILSAIGSVIAGPIGAIVGAIAGSAVDRAIIGSPTAKSEGPRLSDLTVQSSAYGEAIPLVFGAARVAGNVIWSSGLIETRHENTTRVGGKGGGRVQQVTYSYAASIAVALAGRRIQTIGRIWADGKLIRPGPNAALSVGGTLRIYSGSGGQAADPLLQAALGVTQTPAYRGLAYVSFERLELAEFANRVPNLTFEVIADQVLPSAPAIAPRVIADELAARSGLAAIDASGWSGSMTGAVVGREATARAVLDTVAAIHPMTLMDLGDRVRLLDPPMSAQVTLDADWLGADAGGDAKPQVNESRAAESTLPREVALAHADPARDYQVGLQRARRSTTQSRRLETRELPLVVSADQAKRAAEQVLARSWRRRRRIVVRTPWRQLGLCPGVTIAIEGQSTTWLVDDVTVEGGVVEISATPVDSNDQISVATASSGTAIAQPTVEHGPSTLVAFELPAMGGTVPTTASLWLATAGASTGWRRALIYGSADAGATYDFWAELVGPAGLGVTVDSLGVGPAAIWDRSGSVQIDLLSPTVSLEGRSEASVQAGANLLWLNGELIQFMDAVLVAPGRWRLSGLLRGRFGTEISVAHPIGAAVALVTPASLAAIDLGSAVVGGSVLLKALSPYQTLGAVIAQTTPIVGRGLMPPAPVHLRATRGAAGLVTIQWVRRSRAGYEWVDGIDAPLAEEAEAYDVEIWQGGTRRRLVRVTAASFAYALADQTSDLGGAAGATLDVAIAQISGRVGRGVVARRLLTIQE